MATHKKASFREVNEASSKQLDTLDETRDGPSSKTFLSWCSKYGNKKWTSFASAMKENIWPPITAPTGNWRFSGLLKICAERKFSDIFGM